MATNKQRPGMMLYFEDIRAIERFSDAQIGKLLRLLMDYAETGELPEIDDERVDTAMCIFKAKVDRDRKHYEDLSKKRSSAAKKSHARDEEQMLPLQPTASATATPTATSTATATASASPVFVPPTREQAAAYADEIGFASGVDRFMDYYSGVGWQMGAKPMRDWRAAMRMWKRKDAGKETNTHAGYTEPDDAELFKGMSAEDIALLDELAAEHWG